MGESTWNGEAPRACCDAHHCHDSGHKESLEDLQDTESARNQV